jgi:trk system potassium uptake protein TrkH
VIFSLLMLVPAASAIVQDAPGGLAFTVSALICSLLSLMVALATRGPPLELSTRFGFLLVNLMWWGGTVVCAVPYMVGPLGLSFPDALFEAASGLTTTGATILTGLDTTGHPTLLWRAMTQFLGGFGILLLGLLVLPFLSVGGMQLFRMESSDRSDKPMPRFISLARALLAIYGALVGLCATGYLMSGMSAFDAITHAMTTVSTAGFANYDASFGHFDGTGVLLVGTLFMIAGSLPLTLFILLFSFRQRLRLDPQVKVFFGLVAVFAVLFAIERTDGRSADLRGLAEALFNSTSLLTTTGFSAGDYTAWGPMIAPLVFILMFAGGCSGSTSGGLKTYRIIVMYELVRVSLLRALHPRGVFVMRYGGRAVDPEVFRAAMVMVMVTFAAVGAGGIMLGASGLDFETALSGAVSAVMNIGPGLGPIIGPSGTFAPLPDDAKLIIAALMILGRLEILAVLVLFVPRFWRG